MSETIQIRSSADCDKLHCKTKLGPRRMIKVRKWVAFVTIAVAFALCGTVAEAQQPAKVAKIGWLESGTTDRGSRLGELFLSRLSELGYVEGRNITFEYRSADNKLDRLPVLAAELVRLNI